MSSLQDKLHSTDWLAFRSMLLLLGVAMRWNDPADRPDLLAEFATAIQKAGLVGETGNAQILFLSIISNLLNKPVAKLKSKASA